MSEMGAIPTPKQIDRAIEAYAAAQHLAQEAKGVASSRSVTADEMKAELVAMVEAFGVRHTEKSKRLAGARHSATTTVATLVKVDDRAVDQMKAYLDDAEIEGLSETFFSERVTYQMVGSPEEELKKLTLPTKIRNKILGLIKACTIITTKAPSLKVDVAEGA